jgi:AraC-like DNA-binding protein
LFEDVMRTNASQHTFHQQEAKVACTSLLIELAQYAQQQITEADLAIQELALFLQANLHKNYSLLELANHAGINERMLTKRFRREMKKSVHEFITDVHMQKAYFLLQHYPNMRIKEIAYQLGFIDEYQT